MDNDVAARAIALQQLQVAIDLIELTEKVDYLYALRAAPQLVAIESDPFCFLRYTEYDVWAAARKLVHYWKQRREIFGDRAFLPLTIVPTIASALMAEDISLIRQGTMCMLPNDMDGRTVAAFDSNRVDRFPFINRLRTAFYFGQIGSENPLSQTEGFQVLILVRKLFRETYTPKVTPIVLNTLPIKKKKAHIFNCLQNWPHLFLLGAVYANGLLQFFQSLFGSDDQQTCIHTSQQPEELTTIMATHRIRPEGLPVALGGSWTNTQFQQWMTDRTRLEQERYGESPFATGGARLASNAPDDSMEEDSTAAAPPGSNTAGYTAATGTAVEASIAGMSLASSGNMAQVVIRNDELRHEIDKLPPTVTGSLSEAISTASKLIWESESNPDLFLRTERSCAQMAAKRMARYWSLRSKLFSSKKFSKMEQCGEEALGKKDLTILSSGFLQLLPNDSSGHSVLWVDSTHLPSDGPVITNRDRCLFYMMTLLCENAKSQEEGAILLFRLPPEPTTQRSDVASLSSPSSSSADNNITPDILAAMTSALPLRFHTIHIFWRQPLAADLATQIGAIGERVYAHVMESNCGKGEMVRRLQPFGFRKRGLPSFLEGDWSYSMFVEWLELRTRMEWRIPQSHSGGRDSRMDLRADFPAIRPYEPLPEEDKDEKSRRLNVIHCRRKNFRMLVEVGLLRDQSKELESEQVHLQEENRRLQQLVRTAREMVE